MIRHLGLSGFSRSTATCSSWREVAAEAWSGVGAAVDAARAGARPSVSSIVCYLIGLSHIDPIETSCCSDDSSTRSSPRCLTSTSTSRATYVTC